MLRIKGKRCHVTVLVHGLRPITIGLYYSFQCFHVSSRNNGANNTYFCPKLKSYHRKSYGRRFRGDCIDSLGIGRRKLFEQHCRGVSVILNTKKPARIFSLIILKLRCLLLKKSKQLWKRRSQTLCAKYQAKISFLAKIVTGFASRKMA